MVALYKTNRHSCFNLRYHLVVVTKYKAECIDKTLLECLKKITYNIFNKWDCIIIDINSKPYYFHVYFEAPPQVQLSKLINNIKTVSSRLIRKNFNNYLSKFYSNEPFFWSESYLIVSSGENIEMIIEEYFKNQIKKI